MEHNTYYSLQLDDDDLSRGEHRKAVGGFWEEIGTLQMAFLQEQGLSSEMNFLDVGCGCLRGGVHFIEFLESGRYFGIDLNQDLLDAGYEVELARAGLQHKLPRENLLQEGDFRFSRFNQEFDCALALSVFSHLPLNHIRLCLIELARVFRPGGKFFATFFHCPSENALETPLLHHPGEVTTFPTKDPYHYWVEDISFCLQGLPWRIEHYGPWDHPRAQEMLIFHKLDEPTNG